MKSLVLIGYLQVSMSRMLGNLSSIAFCLGPIYPSSYKLLNSMQMHKFRPILSFMLPWKPPPSDR